MQNIALVISGPAGVGKTTICDRLIKEFGLSLKRVVTSTTRKPRDSELEGKDYFFINQEDFVMMQEKDAFIEFAKIHGNYYGTTKLALSEQLEKKFDALLNIDVQGAASLKKLQKQDELFTKNLYSVFLTPRSLGDLRERLIKRGQDSLDEIENRILSAEIEISMKDSFDHIICSNSRESDYAKVRDIYISISEIALLKATN